MISGNLDSIERETEIEGLNPVQKPKKKNRDFLLSVRLKIDEKALLLLKAKQDGVTVSTLVRRLINEAL